MVRARGHPKAVADATETLFTRRRTPRPSAGAPPRGGPRSRRLALPESVLDLSADMQYPLDRTIAAANGLEHEVQPRVAVRSVGMGEARRRTGDRPRLASAVDAIERLAKCRVELGACVADRPADEIVTAGDARGDGIHKRVDVIRASRDRHHERRARVRVGRFRDVGTRAAAAPIRALDV